MIELPDVEETTQPILIIDGMNLFIRSFAAYPSMSVNGDQMGGVVGFMKTMKRVVGDIRPKKIFVAWEGGGSARRRSLYKDYKAQRKPEKLNRFYEDDIPESEENRVRQIRILTRMLKHLPVCQIYVSDCEGDDVIAYLCRRKFPDETKVIMSSDKDFYQLLDEKTRIYSLHKKVYLTADKIKEEFNIHMKNFALAKSLCGDASDNIPGVKGLGFKTLAKRFPIFASDADLMIDDVLAYSQARLKESATYRHVAENGDLIRRNWQLVYLGDQSMASYQTEKVDQVIETFKPSVNKIEFIRRLITEGIQDFEIDDFFLTFLCVSFE